MAERTSRKIPVTERQFLWVQDDDKGEVILHVGPTMVSPTAADRVVVDDGQGGFTEDTTWQPQRMIELGDNQYAAITNPIVETAEAQGPNGKFRPGRNEPRVLKSGTRAMLPGPCSFYLRPGQRCEVRDAHELASNQYLVVKVYGEVDEKAPYFEITHRSAGITTFTTDTSAAVTDKQRPAQLKRGQLIVIRGLDTQFYIPPTGVDVVPDTSVDAAGTAMTADAARALLTQLRSAPPPPPPAGLAMPMPQQAPSSASMESEALLDDFSEAESKREMAQKPMRRGGPPPQHIEQGARLRHRVPAQAQAAAMPIVAPALLSNIMQSPELRRAVEQQARQLRLVREAVVLGEKEYCVVIDADGKRSVKRGPARVFPGPTTPSRPRARGTASTTPTSSSPARPVAALHLADRARRHGEAAPVGASALEKVRFEPGDELLLTGVSTFFFPFNEIEVLSPETGLAVVGNDHTKVFVEAIGIDQKSGIYVRDLTTGEARLVKGKTSYMVHPGKEVHITRTIPAEDWNHWVAPGEPHKQTSAPITTPWALSIVVPHNSACMATSASGHRVIEGPCVELLEYEEQLSYLQLSTGTPKRDEGLIRTCFLRTIGNRVSDVIRVQTADFVDIDARVSYTVTFLRDYKERWFNHENYVQVLVEHTRSLVRSRCRTISLGDLWPRLTSTLRDVILGDKVEGQERPGRLFKENGMLVTEVEVLTAEILDPQIAKLYHDVQRQIVSLQIGDREAQASLHSQRLRATVEIERQALDRAAEQRRAEVGELIRGLKQKAALAQVEGQAQVDVAAAEAAAAKDMAGARAQLLKLQEQQKVDRELLAARADAEAAARRRHDAATLELEKERHALELARIEAAAQATVAERQAVQAGLVEAMTALGDKIVLGEVAQNMNLVSLFKGKDVGTLLQEVLGGTKVMGTLRDLQAKHGSVGTTTTTTKPSA
jgi:major vault protein